MNSACTEFRERLAQLLSGQSDERAIGALSWHEHLLACEECRALLEAEQALEQLLASLPRPHLPPELNARVLARLEPHRPSEAALDRLLELPTADVPRSLATDVLARLSAARVQARELDALERLLARVPTPIAPADLKDRVLTGLRFERERARPAPTRPLALAATGRENALKTSVSRARRLALAAALAIGLGLTALWFATRTSTKPQELAGADTRPVEREPRTLGDEPSPDLLASLDLLESWELVASDDIDVQLNALNSVDELLLSVEADAGAEQPDSKPSESSPTKG